MKKLIASTLTLMLLLSLKVSAADFYPDVLDSYKYFNAIKFISDNGIVEGYPDGTYQPGRLLNRAELLKILMEANYKESDFGGYSNDECFNDVPAGVWFTQYVCAAEAAGIVKGYDDGNFKPEANINLVEALKITLKTFGYNYEELDPWYKGIVDQAALYNFIPLDFAHFDDKVNRGQMADMIARILKYQGGILDQYLGSKAAFKATYETLLRGELTEEISVNTATLLSKVCDPSTGANYGEKYFCSGEKEASYGCENVSEVKYFDYTFLKCNMYQVKEDQVLVYRGSSLQQGYNLIAEKSGNPVVIPTAADLLDFWGPIDSEDSALAFAMAASGYEKLEPYSGLKDYYGDDFVLNEGVTISYSVVKKIDGEYEVPLYPREVFGCGPFDIHERIYLVSDNRFTLKDEKKIGRNESGICID